MSIASASAIADWNGEEAEVVGDADEARRQVRVRNEPLIGE
jgi:hypothetical protein